MNQANALRELIEKLNAMSFLCNNRELQSKSARILSEIETLFGDVCKKNDELKSMLELGHKEMASVWELIQSRESLIRAILGASQDIILTVNSAQQIIEFNHSAEDFFGISKSAAQGKSIFTIFRGGSLLEDLQNIFPQAPRDLDGYFGKLHERTIILHTGKEITISIFPNKIVSGDKTFYTLYLHDLTEAKETEALIENSRAQMLLTSKFSALGEMAGGIAHEINTPLAVIQMRTEQLLESLSDDDLDKGMFETALQSVDKTVRRIAKIVQGLRSFARDGRMDTPVVVSLNQVIEDTFSLCREKYYNHGVDISFESGEDFDICCRANEISQVLLNLFNNAFDAISSNKEKWVRVRSERRDDDICIYVTDSGTGIPREIQDKIMQPFFTTKDIGKGTGLGLSISRGIIEAHNGQLVVDNNFPNTTFCIFLPLAKQGEKQAVS